MNLAGYYEKHGRSGLEALAKKTGRSADYLSQIVHGHRCAGWRLCQELEDASGGEISRHDERPDIFGVATSGNPPAAIRDS